MSGKEQLAKRLFGDRPRTNILKKQEQKAISTLVTLVPAFVTPNMLTAFGFFGSLLVLCGFLLAKYGSMHFLWLAIVGLLLNWVGDSLDGRVAYYRKIPRKWYGFSLDIIMDWQSTLVMGLGCLLYLTNDLAQAVTYLLVAMYGWAMIIAQLRFKIIGSYRIDSGIVGPTEFRIVLAFVILSEFFFPGSLVYFLSALSFLLFIINLSDTRKLLAAANLVDAIEKEESVKK